VIRTIYILKEINLLKPEISNCGKMKLNKLVSRKFSGAIIYSNQIPQFSLKRKFNTEQYFQQKHISLQKIFRSHYL
jgi:hypothetical protein